MTSTEICLLIERIRKLKRSENEKDLEELKEIEKKISKINLEK